jgi:NDP-sugar pyrophosphorylase family protein
MCVRTYTHQIPLGVVRSNEKNELVQIDEKPSFDYFVNSGMYVLDGSVLSMIPENKKLDMPDFLNSIAHSESNSAVNLYPLHEYWLDIGQINDFNKAQIDFVADFND